jgi:anti-sigma factor RsiW
MSTESQSISELHATDRLPEYVRGTLPEGDRDVVEGHLAVCADCRRERELLIALADAAAGELSPAEQDRFHVPLRRSSRAGVWRAGVWRAAAGVVILLTSYGIWMASQDGGEGGAAWSADAAVAGWEEDLSELSPRAFELQVVLGESLEASWPEFEGGDVSGLRGPWEESSR